MIDLPLMIHHEKVQCKSWIPVCITEVMFNLEVKPMNLNNSRTLKVEYSNCILHIKVTKRSKQYTVVIVEEEK